MKRQPTKPTGTIGPVRLSGEGLEFQQIDFPRTKDEVEAFIVRSFLNSSGSLPLAIDNFSQNEQNDFDFTINTSEGRKYLELMEIAPLENLRGSYQSAPSKYKPYDFAEYIFKKMMGKSDKYQGAASSNICLLIYITDWAFTLSETIVALLQYWAAHKQHSFQYVFCYSPIDQNAGVTKLIFPTPLEFWSGFNPEAFRNNEVINLSPLKWELVSSKGDSAQ